MKLCEIEDKEKLKLLLKGNVLNNSEQFNSYKAKLRNKSLDFLMLHKSDIINDLTKLESIIINATVTLYDYEDDTEAESLISQYEILLGKVGFAKDSTIRNEFVWIKR